MAQKDEPFWKQGIRGVGNFLYQYTPADNVMNIVREFKSPGGPNWGNIASNVAYGAGDLAMFAFPGAKAGRAAYYAGRTLPGVARSAARAGTTTVFGVPLAMGALGSGGAQTPFRAEGGTLQGPFPNYQQGTDQEDMEDNGGGYAPVEADVGQVPQDLFALDPRVQAQIDASRRGAVSANERALSDIATRGTQLSIGGSAARRGIGRRARGGLLDLMSGLSEMGYSGSPAMAGVGQEAIARREASERARAAQELAGGRAQLGQETVASQQNLREILSRLNAEETAGRAYASFQGLQNFYGGR